MELLNPTFAGPAAGHALVAERTSPLVLDGAHIGLVNNAWPSWRLMSAHLAQLLAERYRGVSTAEFVVPNGVAAPHEQLEVVARSAECAFVGVANCGSCTAWSFHDAAVLMRAGVRVVLVVSAAFESLARALASARRVDMPMVVLPDNPETLTDAAALAMLEEHFDELCATLIAGTDRVPRSASAREEVATRTVEVGEIDDEAIYEYCYAKGWTDGLPVVAPTPARVERFLESLDAPDPAAVLVELPPSYFPLTYEVLAANAVLAGCAPAYGPLLVAIAEAACEEAFNLNGIATTTGSSTPVIIVNGPVRAALHLNGSRGLLGPGWRANATIGRALRLLMVNVGGAVPGSVSKSIMGQPGRFSFCFAENEEESPFEPLHATLGHDAAASAVTLLGGLGSTSVLTPRRDVEAMLTLFGNSLGYMGNPNIVMGKGAVLVVLSVGHARAMAAAGLSKADIAARIWERSGVARDALPDSVRPDFPYEFIEHDGVVYPVASPDDVYVVVAGGAEPTHALSVASHPDSTPVTRVVSETPREEEVREIAGHAVG